MKTAFVLAAIVALAAADCVWDLSAADDCSIVDLTLAADGACHAIAGYDEDESAGLSITDDVWTLFENQDCSARALKLMPSGTLDALNLMTPLRPLMVLMSSS